MKDHPRLMMRLLLLTLIATSHGAAQRFPRENPPGGTLSNTSTARPESLNTEGLNFLPFDTEPRIYLAAPSGVMVGQVIAVDPRYPFVIPVYHLHGEGQPLTGDNQYFSIHAGSGNITTRRYIDRPVGSNYTVIVVANSRGESKFKEVSIQVTEYNRFPPAFETTQYTISLDVLTPVNQTFLTVRATDRDIQSYNTEVRYSVQMRNNLVSINRMTGELMLLKELSPRYRDLVFTILAHDGGSPKRFAKTKLTIEVKILTKPTEVGVEKTSDNWAKLCWVSPDNGRSDGYVFYLSLKALDIEGDPDIESDKSRYTEFTKNITNDQVIRTAGSERLCDELTDLQSWRDYEVRVAAWNYEEIGMISAPVKFHTRENRTCHIVDGRAFTCGCLAGFYGDNCSLYNPCIGQETPCRNGGTCTSNASNAFQCACVEGYYGHACERFDPCSQNPCDNGKCLNISNSEFTCKCDPGYEGETCNVDIDECASNPCQNRGTCKDEVNGFTCQCHIEFKGKYCEEENNECESSPCYNGGACTDGIGAFNCLCPNGYEGERCEKETNECLSNPCENEGICVDGNDTFECLCKVGYEGEYCEDEINECSSLPCLNGATCKDAFNDFICQCRNGFTGKTCEVDMVHCPNEILDTERGSFSWQHVEYGNTVRVACPYGIDENRKANKDSIYSMKHNRNYFEWSARLLPSSRSLRQTRGRDLVKGPAQTKEEHIKLKSAANNVWQREMIEHKIRLGENGTGYAVRSCIQMEDGSVKWTPMIDSICRDKGSNNAEKRSIELEAQTSDPNLVDAAMFILATTNVNEILSYALYDKKIASRMINVISNLMAANDSVIEEVAMNGSSTRMLVHIVETYTNQAKFMGDSKNITIHSNNLALEVLEVGLEETNSNFVQGITYTPPHKSTKELPKHRTLSNSTPDISEEDISINIPNEALFRASTNLKKARVFFVSYKTGKLFRPKKGRFQNSSTKAPVLVASISNVTVDNLTEVLAYSYPNIQQSRKHVCVYWAPERQEWKEDGLTTNESEDVIECESVHMTAFSVLLDPDPEYLIAPKHQSILSVISYIGSICSMVGLTFTIITYSIFRYLNRDRSGKILLNLCISLVLMNFTYLLISVKDQLSYKNLCPFIAFLTHYFVLTSLSWMLVEAVNMYQLLVTVFATTETRFMLKRIVCAWGLPLVAVASAAAYDIDYYYSVDTDFCVIAPSHLSIYYIAYLGPSCTILAINCVVFVLVSRILFQKRAAGKVGGLDNRITVAQVRGAFTVMTLLGVTWIFGAFAIGHAKLVFQYIFCFSNSLQGFIIFLVRCVQYSEARMAWSTLLRTGKFKKYRGVLPNSSTRHTLSSSTLGSQSTRNAALDNSIGSTNTLWNRLFQRKPQKPKVHTYSNYSFRHTYGSARIPNYFPRHGQKTSTIRKGGNEMNMTSMDAILMREMQKSMPPSKPNRLSARNVQYATCIPRMPTDDNKTSSRALQTIANEPPPLPSRAPLDAIRKAWSQESLDNKEGEDTSWQFMRVPMSKKKENVAPKGAIKKVAPSANGKMTTIFNADQGGMTAEGSPENLRKKMRPLVNIDSELPMVTDSAVIKSGIEGFDSSLKPPRPVSLPPLKPRKPPQIRKKGNDTEMKESKIENVYQTPGEKTRRDVEVPEALLLLGNQEVHLKKPVLRVEEDRVYLGKTCVQDGSRLRRVSLGNIECQLACEIKMPCFDHPALRTKSFSSGDISGSNASLCPEQPKGACAVDAEMWNLLPIKKTTKRICCNELV